MYLNETKEWLARTQSFRNERIHMPPALCSWVANVTSQAVRDQVFFDGLCDYTAASQRTTADQLKAQVEE